MEHLLTFIVPGDAVGKGRPRVTMHGTYTPSKTKVYCNAVKSVADRAMRILWAEQPWLNADDSERDTPPLFIVPLHIDIQIRVTIPKSWSKNDRMLALRGDIHPTSKPDKDNVEKAILDACNGVVWLDDSYICSGTFVKHYAEIPCAIVTVRRLPGAIAQADAK